MLRAMAAASNNIRMLPSTQNLRQKNKNNEFACKLQQEASRKKTTVNRIRNRTGIHSKINTVWLNNCGGYSLYMHPISSHILYIEKLKYRTNLSKVENLKSDTATQITLTALKEKNRRRKIAQRK
jgi:hypothetical protein